MQSHGCTVVPVNPRYAASGTEILGQKAYVDLADIPFPVDMVDVFRRTEDILPIARQAIAIGARCLWQQIGVINREADQLVCEAGSTAWLY
jgi:predicted CoA-binding protein